VSHEYYHTDLAAEPVERIFSRFMLCGEGRVDHIAAYMDGFRVWKTLFEDGVRGIIRGDEGFGWEPVSSPLTVRMSIGIDMCADLLNLRGYRDFELPKQEMPESLLQRDGETLAAWRDRLYHTYRIPVILAALSDLKLAYVEQTCPLLSKKILLHVRQMPDHLRTNKALYKKIVSSLGPEIGFATVGANAPAEGVLKAPEIVEFLRAELSSKAARSVFSGTFLSRVLERLRSDRSAVPRKSREVLARMKKLVPVFLKDIARDTVTTQRVDSNTLAFRTYMACKMKRILTEDARATDEVG
jgi:hypothetical protein